MCKRIVDFLLCHILWCVCGIGLFSSLASWQVGVQLNDNGWKYEPSRHCLGIDIHIQSINKQFSLWMILWMCAMQMPINRIECAIQKGTQKFFAFKIKLHSLYCRLVFFSYSSLDTCTSLNRQLNGWVIPFRRLVLINSQEMSAHFILHLLLNFSFPFTILVHPAIYSLYLFLLIELQSRVTEFE